MGSKSVQTPYDRAPYATDERAAKRRYPVGDQSRAFGYRNAFQRDRDRIVYSRAFRRLRHKAQTGVLADYEDHRRNRLTHTLEVAQLARTVSRALQLNEDLAEAIAMGHDLGQPPFGPTGASALDDWLSGRLDRQGGAGLGDLGGFSCGVQGLTIVDKIEKRYQHPGINLTHDVREGILRCHPYRTEHLNSEGLALSLSPSLEQQVVAWADRITSALQKLDDGLQSGILSPTSFERQPLVKELKRKVGTEWPRGKSNFLKANVLHRGLTHLLATGLVLQSQKRLERLLADNPSALAEGERPWPEDLIGLPDKVHAGFHSLEALVDQQLHHAFEYAQAELVGRRVLLGILAAYVSDARLLANHILVQLKINLKIPYLRDLKPHEARQVASKLRTEPSAVRLIAEYVATMTDGYAMKEHRRLMAMGAVPIPSMEQLKREPQASQDYESPLE